MIKPTPITTYVAETNPYTEVDYLEEASKRTTSQFEGRDIFNRYLQLMLSGRVELQKTIKTVLQNRNLDNAQGEQLDVLGEILGQPRQLFDSVIIRYFGFIGATGASPYKSVEDTDRTYGPYKSVRETLLGIRELTDTEYRRILKLKIIKNTSDANITAFNDGIKILFGTDNIDYQEEVPPNYIEGAATITVGIGRDYNDPERAVFPGLDELVLADRFLNKPLGVGILYQDPITFSADFLQPRYEQFVFGSDGLTIVTFEDMFDFSRPYEADYYDDSGTLVTAAVDEPRLTYNPTTLEAEGLLIEGPNEVLTHTWGLEVNDSQGTIRLQLDHENTNATEVALVLEGVDFKVAIFRNNTYWKARVETQDGSDSYEAIISQYPNDSVTLNIAYTPNEVNFFIEDEARLVSINTDYNDTNLRGFDMRIGGTFTTNVGTVYDHFNGKIRKITYTRPYVSNGGKVVVDGMQITTEDYQKILTEYDETFVV